MTHPSTQYFEDLEIGQAYETIHRITEQAIKDFAAVSGDYNPLHMDETYASKTVFGTRIAHGALTASYISGILGNHLPGPGSIFTGLSMRFRRPVYIGDEVTVRAEVKDKIERGNRIVLAVSCSVNGKRAITGEAEVVAPKRSD